MLPTTGPQGPSGPSPGHPPSYPCPATAYPCTGSACPNQASLPQAPRHPSVGLAPGGPPKKPKPCWPQRVGPTHLGAFPSSPGPFPPPPQLGSLTHSRQGPGLSCSGTQQLLPEAAQAPVGGGADWPSRAAGDLQASASGWHQPGNQSLLEPEVWAWAAGAREVHRTVKEGQRSKHRAEEMYRKGPRGAWHKGPCALGKQTNNRAPRPGDLPPTAAHCLGEPPPPAENPSPASHPHRPGPSQLLEAPFRPCGGASAVHTVGVLDPHFPLLSSPGVPTTLGARCPTSSHQRRSF